MLGISQIYMLRCLRNFVNSLRQDCLFNTSTTVRACTTARNMALIASDAPAPNVSVSSALPPAPGNMVVVVVVVSHNKTSSELFVVVVVVVDACGTLVFTVATVGVASSSSSAAALRFRPDGRKYGQGLDVDDADDRRDDRDRRS